MTLDPTLLAELLGRAELRELLDPAVIEHTELELQRLTEDRRAKDVEGVADLLRMLGPLTTTEVAARLQPDVASHAATWLGELQDSRRAIEVAIAGEVRWAVVEDAGRLRDALGVVVPMGVPEAFLEVTADPLDRSHLPLHAHPRAIHDRRGRLPLRPRQLPSRCRCCAGSRATAG